jgi:hypothetical protein
MDSDQDGIIDSLEYALGLSPIDEADGAADPEADGVVNHKEALRGTSPFVDDRHVPHQTFVDAIIHETRQDDGTFCYDLSVTGVQLFPTREVTENTLGSTNHARNQNIIRFLFIEVPEDSPSAKPVILEAYRTVSFKGDGSSVLEPINLTLDDFEMIGE